MTKRLLWEEYHAQYQACAYGYTQFCEYYTRWFKKLKRSNTSRAISSSSITVANRSYRYPETGEIRMAQFFVVTLGASNYTYVEASKSQRLESWLQAHVNAFEFFGGVPHLLVPITSDR